MEDKDTVENWCTLMQLVNEYPDLSMTLLADVLTECGQDHKKAYEILCEMVIPPDSDNAQPTTTRAASTVPKNAQVIPHAANGPEPIQYAFSETSPYPPEYSDIFQSPLELQSRFGGVATPVPVPLLQNPPDQVLQGAWARKSMGRTYRVTEMCKRYQWMQRSTIEALFDKYGDCVELVESDILEMYPVDQPEAFNGGIDPQPRLAHESSPSNRRRASRVQGGKRTKHQAIAESLRQQAAAQIQRDSFASETISTNSKSMGRLRKELWEARSTRMRMQQLASQTRQPSHIAQAKEKDAELRRLSTFFLARMRQSEEYRDGCIDLHGLTKEEALQLIEWKLQDGSRRRFRVITGKGIHSHNGQAVLRPALEKYFRGKGIAFSMFEDAVMSVIP